MKKYIVVHTHHSNYPDPIVLSKGDVVLYGKEDTEFPNWIFCEALHSRKKGWVPKQMLSAPDDKLMARVQQNYSAHELNIAPGMIVEKESELNEWSLVFTADGEKGWVPNKVITPLKL